MTWTFDLDFYSKLVRKDLNTNKKCERIKMIRLLICRGAKWIPKDRGDINYARKALLKMSSDYTVEFIWIMSQYKACSREEANHYTTLAQIEIIPT
jgi:hypothetical protein